jgi:hypothetical protein
MKKPLQNILTDRAATHGDFAENSRISQEIKAVMRSGANWAGLSPSRKEALEMIALKLGRILGGNPDESDHWQDMAGYAHLGEKGRFCPVSAKSDALKCP